MIIADNSTTTVTLDFSDTVLLAGTLADPLFHLVELGECAGRDRLFLAAFLVGRAQQSSTISRTSASMADSCQRRGRAAAAGLDLRPRLRRLRRIGPSARSGAARWEIIGDGVANAGMITQSADLDSDGVPIIAAQHRLFGALRAMIDPNAPATQGTAHVHLYSASQRHRHGRST